MKAESSERIATVVEGCADKFGLYSFQIDHTDSSVWIEMDESKSEAALMEYLKKNINKNHLNQYNFHFQKTSQEKIETEEFLSELSHIASEYVRERDYQDVRIMYPTIEPKPTITVIISKESEQSIEELKTELEDLFISKIAELPKKEIPYQLHVIKE